MNNYAIPGFQQPSHPKLDERVFSRADGLIDFMFMSDIPRDRIMPLFEVYIDLERGREINLQASTHSNRFIYEKVDEERNLKSWWFRLRIDDLTVLTGTYRVRFVVNGTEVANRSLTIVSSPAHRLPCRPYAELAAFYFECGQ